MPSSAILAWQEQRLKQKQRRRPRQGVPWRPSHAWEILALREGHSLHRRNQSCRNRLMIHQTNHQNQTNRLMIHQNQTNRLMIHQTNRLRNRQNQMNRQKNRLMIHQKNRQTNRLMIHQKNRQRKTYL